MHTARIALLAAAALCLAGAVAVAATVAPVHLLYVRGQIDPPTTSYVRDGIRRAEDVAAQAVLIVMDTPGGLVDSTREIVQAFLASKVPVIVYVSPNGAWAASAGAIITMAADVAAMAPVSNIGSASPVEISPGGQEGKTDETMKKKAFNALAEYAKSIAEKRGRNVKWAEAAVREAANLGATAALRKGVIDVIANDNADLMRKLDGRKVTVVSTGRTVTLYTAKAPVEAYPMGPWDSFLHLLSHPYVAMFLLLMATYGIIYEIANPGAIFPGVIGAISVLLLLYSFSVIPVNTAGFAFMGLAIALFLIELFTPTHGVLTVGGVVSMFFGLVMLFRASEGFMVSIWAIAAVTLVTAGFFLVVIGLGVRALRNPYVSGREGVVGHIGEARTDLDPTGKIFVDGSLWSATSESGKIETGEKVEVTQMSGLKLTVRKHAES